MIEYKGISLGSDPEVFAKDSSGKFIPAYYALGGDVDVELGDGDNAYCDGAAVEFTVKFDYDPAIIARRTMDHLRKIDEHLRNTSGTRVSLQSQADFKEFIPKLPMSLGKRASLQILGCDADTVVFDWVHPIEKPDPRRYPYRTLGGHIHVGVGTEAILNIEVIQYIVAGFDMLLGTAATYLSDDQYSRDRKKLYGKSSTIRVKDSYGAIEYRTLPAKALVHDQTTAEMFFSLAKKSAYNVLHGIDKFGAYDMFDKLGGIDIIQATTAAINDHNVGDCRELQAKALSLFAEFSPISIEKEVTYFQTIKTFNDEVVF